jgi:hypothetical protein
MAPPPRTCHGGIADLRRQIPGPLLSLLVHSACFALCMWFTGNNSLQKSEATVHTAAAENGAPHPPAASPPEDPCKRGALCDHTSMFSVRKSPRAGQGI